MDKQYDSGYVHINNIENYSDQALQELAKQICRAVRSTLAVHINFTQSFTALLADLVMHHVTRVYTAFMNEQWRLDVTVLLPFSERPQGPHVTFVLAGDSDHVTDGPVHELTLLTRGPALIVTATSPYHVHAFSEICLGGTFDRLHVGHKVLLTAGLILAVTRVIVGLTGDVLLKNKKHRELIQPFSERSQHVTEFMKRVKPNIALLISELTEPAGPSATEPRAACLVATQETAGALDSINQIRQSHGLQPLVSYVLGMLPPPKELAQYDSKISSTALRALDQGK